MLFLESMEETGLSCDIFFKFSLRLFKVVEVKWRSMLNFEAATSQFCNCSWKFGSWPQKGKVDLCMTNDSKILIYLTLLYFLLLYFLLHYLQEYSKIRNITKSNKSELWKIASFFVQFLHNLFGSSAQIVNDYRTIIGQFFRKSLEILVYRNILIEFKGYSLRF